MPGRDCGQVRLENKLWHDESVIALARITMPWFAGSRVRGFAAVRELPLGVRPVPASRERAAGRPHQAAKDQFGLTGAHWRVPAVPGSVAIWWLVAASVFL